MTLQVGIVGAGRAGYRKANVLQSHPDVRIAGVADPNRPIRDTFASKFGIRLAVSDHRRLSADENIDAIYICTPPATHHSIAMDALTAGKHVVIEQPIAMSINDGEEMMAAAEVHSLVLAVALPQRYDPANQEAARIMDSDEIGYPFLTISSYLENELDRMNDWHDWIGTWDMGGGGILMQRGSEIIDLLRYLLGDIGAVSAVNSRFAITPLNKAEDSCMLGIEFVEDVTAEVALTAAARYSTWPESYSGTAFRVEIYGVDGSIRITNSEPKLAVVSRKGGSRTLDSSEINTGLPTNMDRDFIDCMINGTKPLVTSEDALEALRAVLSGYKSSQMKRRVEILEQV